MAIREVGLDVDEYAEFIKTQLAEAKRYHAWMPNVEEEHFHEWAIQYDAQKMNANRIETPPTSKEFWRAAYDYGTLGPNAADDPKDLLRLIASGLAGPYTIGKLYGITTLKLTPAIGALTASEIPVPGWSSPFEFAATDSGAISYPDGHPSATWDATYLLRSSSSSRDPMRTRFKAEDDDKLRRFAALGWVIMQNEEGAWQKTGHVMVIDMDDRDVRHRQPWFILASEWPADGEDLGDDTFTIRAPENVERNDSTQAGVFPGDNNRTPICRIVPHDRAETRGEIILSELGEDFNFAPERKGGHRNWRTTNKGPALARVMNWYLDPVTQEQVCYGKQGREWTRYDPRSREYYFPDLDFDALEGEVGLFGALYGLPVAEVPNPQWKRYEEYDRDLRNEGWRPAAEAQARHTPRQVSKSMGY